MRNKSNMLFQPQMDADEHDLFAFILVSKRKKLITKVLKIK